MSIYRINIIRKILLLIEKFTFNYSLSKFYKQQFKTGINCVLDVGTNRGQSIDIFKSISKNCVIYGFEPNLKLYNFLLKKYDNNKQVMLYNVGVSSKTGRLTFYENALDLTSSFEEPNFKSEYTVLKAKILGFSDPKDMITDKYEVVVITLSDFLRSNSITKVDILKIDVEGHELDCLNGLFVNYSTNKFNINYIQIEDHIDDMYAESFSEIRKLLNDNDFEEVHRIKHYVGKFEEVIFSNNKLQT